MSEASFQAPASLLIVGSGVFGLSTAYALTQRPEWASTRITVLDRAARGQPYPARDAASIDSSRIIRADYADPAYASLACQAQVEWRKQGPDHIGGEGRYTESGLALVADEGPLVKRSSHGHEVKTGLGFARQAYANAVHEARREGRPEGFIRVLDGPDAVRGASGTDAPFGDWGYLNPGSGWADAEAAMDWLYARVAATGRVEFASGTVACLEVEGRRVVGAKLTDGQSLRADLVLLAAGAWTPSLLDVRGQVVATGQILGYLQLDDAEQKKLDKVPVMLNLSSGAFLIPPRNKVLKVGLHAYGYQNPKKITTALVVPKGPSDSNPFPEITVSQPYTHLDDPDIWMPAESEQALRRGLQKMVPWPELKERPFTANRVCWYTDTATGDFLISYHPHWEGLFIATGGSGHGFKFLPVLGDKIADCVQGKCPTEFQNKWQWKEVNDINRAVMTEDGSRSGKTGLTLQGEFRKQKSRL